MVIISFDKIFNAFLPKYNKLDVKFNIKKQVERNFYYFPNSRKCCLIIFASNRKSIWNSLFKRRFERLGYSFLSYKIGQNILSSDYELTRKNFGIVKKRIILDLIDLKKKYKFSEFEVIGISLACVNALMVANGNNFVNKIILIGPGNCLAESMWKGIRTQYIKKEYEKKGITLGELKRYWEELAPENNTDKIKNKEIYVQLSKADRVIPYDCGKKLVSKIRKKGLKPFIKENKHLGHYGSILKFYINPDKNIFK